MNFESKRQREAKERNRPTLFLYLLGEIQEPTVKQKQQRIIATAC